MRTVPLRDSRRGGATRRRGSILMILLYFLFPITLFIGKVHWRTGGILPPPPPGTFLCSPTLGPGLRARQVATSRFCISIQRIMALAEPPRSHENGVVVVAESTSALLGAA